MNNTPFFIADGEALVAVSGSAEASAAPADASVRQTSRAVFFSASKTTKTRQTMNSPKSSSAPTSMPRTLSKVETTS